MQSGAVKNLEYSGSISYDLSRFDKRKRVRDALEQEPVVVTRPIAKPLERAQAAAKAKSRSVVSASTILGVLTVAVLMFCVVLNYMRLNEVTIQVSNLKTELKELQSDAAVLQVKGEQNLSAARIEEAASQMGMIRPGKDQIVYIDMSQPDKGVILADTAGKNDFLNGIKTFFFAAVDFIK